MSKQKQPQIYSIELKIKAVNMYLEEKIGSTTIAKTLGLNRCDRVLLARGSLCSP